MLKDKGLFRGGDTAPPPRISIVLEKKEGRMDDLIKKNVLLYLMAFLRPRHLYVSLKWVFFQGALPYKCCFLVVFATFS